MAFTRSPSPERPSEQDGRPATFLDGALLEASGGKKGLERRIGRMGMRLGPLRVHLVEPVEGGLDDLGRLGARGVVDPGRQQHLVEARRGRGGRGRARGPSGSRGGRARRRGRGSTRPPRPAGVDGVRTAAPRGSPPPRGRARTRPGRPPRRTGAPPGRACPWRSRPPARARPPPGRRRRAGARRRRSRPGCGPPPCGRPSPPSPGSGAWRRRSAPSGSIPGRSRVRGSPAPPRRPPPADSPRACCGA